MKEPRVFWLHFNRLNAKRRDKDCWTVHLSDRLIQTRSIVCRVPIYTVYKGATARQPRAYFKGVGIVTHTKRGVVIV